MTSIRKRNRKHNTKDIPETLLSTFCVIEAQKPLSCPRYNVGDINWRTQRGDVELRRSDSKVDRDECSLFNFLPFLHRWVHWMSSTVTTCLNFLLRGGERCSSEKPTAPRLQNIRLWPWAPTICPNGGWSGVDPLRIQFAQFSVCVWQIRTKYYDRALHLKRLTILYISQFISPQFLSLSFVS